MPHMTDEQFEEIRTRLYKISGVPHAEAYVEIVRCLNVIEERVERAVVKQVNYLKSINLLLFVIALLLLFRFFK
jgi:hypothetical protein